MENYEEYEIIDAHAHIFPDKIADIATENIGNFYDLKMRNIGNSTNLIESGKKINVSRYLVFSTATNPAQVHNINSFIARECEQHREFIGLGTLHPQSDDMERDFNQILELNLRGIKLHPDFQKFDIDSEEAYKMYEIAEGRLPLLIHFGDRRYEYSAPKKLVQVHKDFPNLKIIAAHLGGYERWEEAQKYLAGMDNVWFDTSSSLDFMPKETAVKYIRNFGIERCFFGTDFPMWRHTSEFYNLMSLGFTHDENQMILADNLRNFFGIL